MVVGILVIVCLTLGALCISYELDSHRITRECRARLTMCRVYEAQQANILKRLNDAIIEWPFPEAPSDRRIEQLLATTVHSRNVNPAHAFVYAIGAAQMLHEVAKMDVPARDASAR